MVELIKRVFSRKQPENVSKSIRCTLEMWNAIEILADKMGESPNAYVVMVLDQFLQVQVEKGNLTLPIIPLNKKSSEVAS